MFSPADEIKNRLDIVEVIGQYVKLTKAGVNYKALCPFHKEKTPSFMVSPSRQIWHCFGCSAGGDIFTFMMKIENIDFPSALKMLAQKAGVPLVYENPALRSQKSKLIEICEAAAKFYQENLKKNKEVIDYLYERGLKDETINEFQLGWASDDWRQLLSYLANKSYQIEDIERTGLIIRKEEPVEISNQRPIRSGTLNEYYDRFRARIMFPIKDVSGSVIGFTGRIFQGKTPLKTIKDINTVGKYVNTPQTLIFDKGKILYGLDKTKNELRQAGLTIIVEGQMDFLAAYQNGLKNIVASSGTALTPYQLAILKRYNQKLVLGYDMDEAGQTAAERGIQLALNNGFDIRILKLPYGKDMADFALKEPNKLTELVNQAQPIMDFYFERSQQLINPNTLEGKKIITNYLLPKIKNLINTIDRSFWLEKLAQFIKVDPKVLEDELMKIKTDTERIILSEDGEEMPAATYQFNTAAILNRRDILSERLFSLISQKPEFVSLILLYQEYFPEPYYTLGKKLAEDPFFLSDKKKVTNSDLAEELIQKIDYLNLKGAYEIELLNNLEIDIEEEIKNSLKELKLESLKDKLNQINQEIKECESVNDQDKLSRLLNDFNQLSQGLKDN